jgi:hypothetical protein
MQLKIFHAAITKSYPDSDRIKLLIKSKSNDYDALLATGLATWPVTGNCKEEDN